MDPSRENNTSSVRKGGWKKRGAKRRPVSFRGTLGVSKPAIRRLARRGGAARVFGINYCFNTRMRSSTPGPSGMPRVKVEVQTDQSASLDLPGPSGLARPRSCTPPGAPSCPPGSGSSSSSPSPERPRKRLMYINPNDPDYWYGFPTLRSGHSLEAARKDPDFAKKNKHSHRSHIRLPGITPGWVKDRERRERRDAASRARIEAKRGWKLIRIRRARRLRAAAARKEAELAAAKKTAKEVLERIVEAACRAADKLKKRKNL